MRILHITDLHIATRTRAIARLQTLPRDLHDLDFAIVSGDLANRAQNPEYTEVALFLKELLTRLKKRDPARVIIVPGNHDVDWTQAIGDEIEPGAIDADDVQNGLASFERSPETADWRFAYGRGRIRRILRLDRTQYHLRFGNFLGFQNSFYRDSKHRRFPFENSDSRHHWSAHVFNHDGGAAGEGVVFYGLSSCHTNDAIHRGASLSMEAINEIRAHAQTEGANLLRIGVWHHGFTTERGHRDYLTFADLALLKSVGLHLGFHGHTHKDQVSDSWQIIRDYFPVFCTGSFAAEPPDRPGGVQNQALLVEIDDNLLRWRLFHFLEDGARWVPEPEQHLPRPGSAGPPPLAIARSQKPPACRIGKHQRQITLDADGIARIDVALSDVAVAGLLPLATPTPGFNEITAQSEAEVRIGDGEARGPEVRLERPNDGIRRYVATVNESATFQTLSWRYFMSNAFALDGVDAQLRPSRNRAWLRLKPDEDAYVYCVETPARELRLALEMPGNKRFIRDVRPVVQAPRQPSPAPIWDDLPDERQQVRLEFDREGANRVALTVANPKVGYRYGFKYGLTTDRPMPGPDVNSFLERTLKSCREDRGQPLADDLTRAMDLAIEQALDTKDRKPPFWVAHLWGDEAGRLLAAFGQFPPAYWGSAFEYGVGLVGHAFRMRRAAVFKRIAAANPDRVSTPSILYRSSAMPNKRYDWIVEVPLLISEHDAAVGTIGMAGLAGDKPSCEAEKKLAEAAGALTRNPESPRAKAKLAGLCEEVSGTFWRTMAKVDEFAADVFRNHWVDDAPPDSPTPSRVLSR